MRYIFAVLLAGVLTVQAVDWDHLYVRWSPTDPKRVNSFFEIPLNADEAARNGWVKATHDKHLNLDIYCLKNDPRVCPVYYPHGSAVGLQIGQPASDLKATKEYDLASQPTVLKKKIFDQVVLTSTYYTVNPADIASRNSSCGNKLLGTEGVWFQQKKGYLMVPKALKDLSSDWAEARCVPTQGEHHFYRASKSLPCQKWLPWFLLHFRGELVGVGFAAPGKSSYAERVWYEPFNASLTNYAIPTAPDCLEGLFKKYDSLILHTFLVNEPWKATCAK